MADTLNFTLVAPERELFSGPVEMVIAPGEAGDFGVLPGHAPFMATLRPGALVIAENGQKRRVFVRGGFADVTPAGLTILAEEAAPLDDIDLEALTREEQELSEDLGDAKDDAARARCEAALARVRAIQAAAADRAYL